MTLTDPAPAPPLGGLGREAWMERGSRVVVTDEGPVLVEGPVEVVMEDGSTVRSDRTLVALCTCRRSRIAPFCDTSHRTKVRVERAEQQPGAAEVRS